MKLIIVAAFAICMLFSPSAGAQHRIGHINSDDVMQAMPEFAQVQVQLDSIKTSYQQVLDAMHAQYATLEKELQYRDESATDSIQDAKLKKLQDLQDAIKDMESKANDDMEKAQEEKMDALKDKYLQAVSAVAHAKGYAYILDASSDAVVYIADNKDDITDAVYKRLGITPVEMPPGFTGPGAQDIGGK